MYINNLAWMIIEIMLCRKSTDLSWDGDEPSAVAGEKDQSVGSQDPTPLPQIELAVEATLQEANMVEGTCTSLMLAALHSSPSLKF
jgi:hypothetical protein